MTSQGVKGSIEGKNCVMALVAALVSGLLAYLFQTNAGGHGDLWYVALFAWVAFVAAGAVLPALPARERSRD